MRAKLIRTDLLVGPHATAYPAEFVAENSVEVPGQVFDGKPVRHWRWGTVLEGPKVWELCRQGVAMPEDDECREAAGLTDEQLSAAQSAYELLLEDDSYQTINNQPVIIDESDDV